MSRTVKSFSKKEAVRFGWDTTRKNLPFLIGVFVVLWLAGFIPGLLDSYEREQPELSLIINILSFVLSLGLTLGSIKIFLGFTDGKKPEFSDLFSLFKPGLLLRYAVGSILYGLVIFFGLLLLVVPGIYFAIKYEFYTYFMVDKNTGIIESFSKSGQITKGNMWNLFLFWLITLLIGLAGIMVFFVGIVVSLPVIALATTFVYRRLSHKA